jgi:hypothetical protein
VTANRRIGWAALWLRASFCFREDVPMRPRADLLVAWPGGPGTRGCMLAARRHGLQVIEIGTLVDLARGAS